MFGSNLKKARKNKKLTQEQLAKIVNCDTSSISKYESGGVIPSLDIMLRLSEILNVSVDYLYGREISCSSVLVPVLGDVRGGIPIEAIQDILDYEEITPEMARQGDHFGLRVTGDSMEPKFSPGDVVIVRRPDVESGDFAVVYVDGDFATVKKIIKNGTSIMLVPLNNNYAPTVYTENEIINMPVTILGKVVELRAKFK